MRKFIWILLLSLGAGSGLAQSGGYIEDLYQGSSKKTKVTSPPPAQTAPARTAPAQTAVTPTPTMQSNQSSMPANWTPAASSSTSAQTFARSYPTASASEDLVTGYDEALQRRLNAYKNYRDMDDAYWKLMESYYQMLQRKYDPDLYNIITYGNEIWAEPKYISALFDGSDPAAGIKSKSYSSTQQQQQQVTVNINVVGDYGDPYYYYGGGWIGYRPYYPWSWGPRPYPYYPYYPGWGPRPYPYHPGWGPRPYYPARPVIWGGSNNNNYYNGGRPAPSVRPGGGNGGGQQYTPGRRNDNGTGVLIRPGSGGNQYRPEVHPSTTQPTQQQPSRNYRRETTPQQQQPARTEQTRPQQPTEQRRSTPAAQPTLPERGFEGGAAGGARRR